MDDVPLGRGFLSRLAAPRVGGCAICRGFVEISRVVVMLAVVAASGVRADPVTDLHQLAEVYRVSDSADGVAALEALADQPDVPSAVGSAATFLLARRAGLAGDIDGMKRGHRALGVVESARLFGHDTNFGAAFSTTESAVESALRANTDASDVFVEGHDVWSAGPEGVFDVGAQFHDAHQMRTALGFVLQSDAAQDVTLHIDATTQVVARVGHVEVLADDGTRALGFGQHAASFRIAAGVTPVVLRLGSKDRSARVRIRVTQPDGTPLNVVTSPLVAAPKPWGPVRRLPEASVRMTLQNALGQLRALSAPLRVGAVDTLQDAMTVEERVHLEDEAHRPGRLTVWREAWVVRERVAGEARADALLDALTRSGAAMVSTNATMAVRRLQGVLDKAPQRVDARLALAQLRLAQGQSLAAAGLYREVLQSTEVDDAAFVEAASFLRYEQSAGQATDQQILSRAEGSDFVPVLDVAIDAAEDHMQYALARRLVERIRSQRPLHRAVRAYDERDLLRLPEARAAKLRGRLVRQLGAALLQEPAQHTYARRRALLLHWAGESAAVDALIAERVARFPHRQEPLELRAEVEHLRAQDDWATASLWAAVAQRPQNESLRALALARTPPEDRLEALIPFDAATAHQTVLDEKTRRRGGAVVRRAVATEVYANGLYTTTERIAIVVADAERARFLREMRFPFSADRESLTVPEAYVREQDGTTRRPQSVEQERAAGKTNGMYTDTLTTVVRFGPLAPGEMIVVRTERRAVGSQNWFGRFFGAMQSPVHLLPTVQWDWVIKSPTGLPLFTGGSGVAVAPPTALGAQMLYRFSLRGHPGIQVEPNLRPVWDDAAYAAVSTYPSWAALGSWYADFVRPQLALDETLRETARALVSDASNDEERAQALYDYVTTQTRYIGVELGVHGWKPYPVVEVARRGYGDCKDMASLFVALANAVGLDANLALIRTRDVGTLPVPVASMWHFNHAGVYLPTLNQFIDATAERTPYGLLPAMDAGAQVLIVDVTPAGAPARFAMIPAPKPEESVNTSTYDIVLDAAGSAQIAGVESFFGRAAVPYRALFENRAHRDARLREQIGGALAGARVETLTFDDVGTGDPVTYRFGAEQAQFVTATGEGRAAPVSLYPQGLTAQLAPTQARTRDAFFVSPYRVKNEVRMSAPPGQVWGDLEDIHVNTAHLTFHQTVRRDGASVVVTDETVLSSRIVPVADYAAFRAACQAADRAMARRLPLRPAGQP